ncbi:MAG: hypothetical protein L6Q94_06740 [Calditrichia bacterium]|nr:hypothetical protein [Calditrichia bacterium]
MGRGIRAGKIFSRAMENSRRPGAAIEILKLLFYLNLKITPPELVLFLSLF